MVLPTHISLSFLLQNYTCQPPSRNMPLAIMHYKIFEPQKESALILVKTPQSLIN